MSEKHGPMKEDSKKVVLYAAVMALGTLFSRIMGLVRESVLAAFFDRYVTDAYYVAFRLPNLFRRILGEGSLSVSFIPVFVEILIEDGKTHPDQISQRARELASAVFSILLVILMTITVLGVVLMKPIMSLLVSGEGYMSIPGKFDLTVWLGQICFTFIFFICFYAYFMAVLNALKKFMLPALAPGFFNIIMIVAALLPAQWFSVRGEVLAWGTLVAGIVQVGLLIPQVIKLGYFPRFTLRWLTPEVRKVMMGVVPSMLGMGVVQITALINTQFASRLGQGSHSWLYWADRVLELPLSLFAVSLGSALLPTLARAWSQGDKEGMTSTANHYLRLIFFLSVPAAVGMFVLTQPIVEILFMRGKFSAEDLLATVAILQVYSFLLLTSSGVRVLAPSFYAIKNTWLPAWVSVVCLGSHFFIAQYLISIMGLVGLAISSLISATLNLALLVISYYWLIGSLQILRFMKSFWKFLLSAVVMGVVLRLYWPLLDILGPEIWGHRVFAKIISLVVVMTLGGLIYLGISYLLGTEELKVNLETIIKRIRRKKV